jgi:membrane-associated HD superfamily phosphohydrolase
MPYKDTETRKAYMKAYQKKYREEHGERMNREKREHYAEHLAHPKVLLTPEQRRANELASHKKSNAKRKDKLKQYRKDNRERLYAYRREYYAKNKERMDAWHKEYNEANKEKRSAQQKEWMQANKKHVKELTKKWRMANKEHIAEKNRRYQPIASVKRLGCPSYAKQCLKYGTKLSNKDIPKELAEAKLLQLMITRELKNEKRN